MNWKTLIGRIQRHGLTETQIAKRVGTTQQNINRLKKKPKALPGWEIGTKLVELAKQISK